MENLAKTSLPGSCKRVAAMIQNKELRRAYVKNMLDAERTFQSMKRKQPKEKE